MKPRKMLSILGWMCIAPALALCQSTMEFQSGTNIEVTGIADICADNVIINGSYTGNGTLCGGALPVELVTMTAQGARNSAVISWTTATETDNFGFEIERRSVNDSRFAIHDSPWANVGFVSGMGTSTAPREYSFADRNVPPGRYAYRIRQIDQNGSFTYSGAVELEVGLAPREFTLSEAYPNPFNPSTTIEFTLPENGHVQLRVYDVQGRLVSTLVDEERLAGVYYQAVFNARDLASGTYLARLEYLGRTLLRKIVLLK